MTYARRHLIPPSALVTIVLLAGCAAKQATYELYGKDVLSTTALHKAVAEAVHDTWQALAKFTADPNGSRHYPSFSQWSRQWGKGESKENTNRVLIRFTTEFDDTSDQHVVIEVISRVDAPTLIVVSCQGPGDPLPVVNKIVSGLEQRGVRRAN